MKRSWPRARLRRAYNKGHQEGRVFVATPQGRVTAELLLAPLAEYIAGERADGEMPPRPPKGLGELVYRREVKPGELALIALAPLLDGINRGWWQRSNEHGVERWSRDPVSALRWLRIQMGRHLCDLLASKRVPTSEDEEARAEAMWPYLKSEWSVELRLRAGHWLMQCAMDLACFERDENDLPAIVPEYRDTFDKAREELMVLGTAFAYRPHSSPPPDWTGLQTQYDDGMRADFVRDWRAGTKAAITAAFKEPGFEHAAGVNCLQKVAFTIDPVMRDLANKFAVDLMGRSGEARDGDQRRVDLDISTVRWLPDQRFWLSYQCDSRGRVYPVPHLSYIREDHVRAMFRFADGMQLGPGDLRWLEIHCANCAGHDKLPLAKRIEWAKEKTDEINAIAADPIKTYEKWCKAGKKKALQYIAACRELAAARQDPVGFVTHLPVAFDASCNGVQHLAMLSRDEGAGRRVNLINCETPQDVYSDVAVRVRDSIAEIAAVSDDKDAEGWRDFFATIDQKTTRQLVKQPVMTYAYAVTLSGMRDQIIEAYEEIAPGRNAPMPSAHYLAKRVWEAAEGLLRGPAQVMECIRQIAGRLADNGSILEWTTPTGFPVSNDYREPNTKSIALPVGAGGRVWCMIAEGSLPKIQRIKARTQCCPAEFRTLAGCRAPDPRRKSRVRRRHYEPSHRARLLCMSCASSEAPQADRPRRDGRAVCGRSLGRSRRAEPAQCARARQVTR
jgi:hypothetical protein